jgi:hypothetical protein
MVESLSRSSGITRLRCNNDQRVDGVDANGTNSDVASALRFMEMPEKHGATHSDRAMPVAIPACSISAPARG